MTRLKNYSVSVPYYASVIVKVQATSKKQALERALDEAHPNLCHQCAHKVEMGEANTDLEPDVEEIK